MSIGPIWHPLLNIPFQPDSNKHHTAYVRTFQSRKEDRQERSLTGMGQRKVSYLWTLVYQSQECKHYAQCLHKMRIINGWQVIHQRFQECHNDCSQSLPRYIQTTLSRHIHWIHRYCIIPRSYQEHSTPDLRYQLNSWLLLVWLLHLSWHKLCLQLKSITSSLKSSKGAVCLGSSPSLKQPGSRHRLRSPQTTRNEGKSV